MKCCLSKAQEDAHLDEDSLGDDGDDMAPPQHDLPTVPEALLVSEPTAQIAFMSPEPRHKGKRKMNIRSPPVRSPSQPTSDGKKKRNKGNGDESVWLGKRK